MARRKKKDVPELIPEEETAVSSSPAEPGAEDSAAGSGPARKGKSAGGKSGKTMTVAEELEEERLRRIAEEMTANAGEVSRTPTWYLALMFGFMVIGLLWLITFYVTETVYPVPGIGYWNIGIGVGLMMIGLIMTTRWR